MSAEHGKVEYHISCVSCRKEICVEAPGYALVDEHLEGLGWKPPAYNEGYLCGECKLRIEGHTTDENGNLVPYAADAKTASGWEYREGQWTNRNAS